MSGNSGKNGSPTALLLLGVSMLALTAGWSELTGRQPDPGGKFFLTMFGGFGALTTFAGVAGFYKAFLQGEKRKAAAQTSGVYGNADFASLDECEAAGLFDPDGLYVGMLEDEPLFYSGKAHLLTCAPARQGKGINVVIPNLLHYSGAVVVTDPKGELAAVTAKHRAERFGHKVVVFNPWGLHGLPQHRINPLQEVIRLADNPALQRGLTDEVKAVALQLLPEPEDARNRFFREGSRTILRSVLLYLALCKPTLCTLPEMWSLTTNPARLMKAAMAMQKSEALGGVLSDLGNDLAFQMQDNPDQFADFRAGAVQALDIYEPGGYLADAVSGSDVDLADVKGGDVSVYLAFPQDRIASHGAALGLIVNQTITGVARSPKDGKALFLLDEFANLGRLSGLAESLTALPGLGVRVWMFVQELAELTRLYGPHTAKTVLSQSEVKQFFAVNTDDMAQSLSRGLGQKTVKTLNHNLGRSVDDEIGESLSETGQPLMRPEEIKLMGGNEQLLLVNGLRPIRCGRMPFWFVSPWREWAETNPVEGDYPAADAVFEVDYQPAPNEE